MKGREKPRVLSVDDEPMVLHAISRSLTFRGTVEIHTTTSPEDALQQITAGDPFAVVISDLRMPGMNGLAFLERVREFAPESVRILLTGEQDFHSAVNAVNSGNVFRFLTKPCPTPVLLQTIDDAVEQHRLLSAERVLLEQTLYGCVRTMTDVLALVSPEAFARANRIRDHLTRLHAWMGGVSDWRLEIATMLSQIGSVALPPEVATRLYTGEVLAKADTEMVERLPSVAVKLLEKIPRLDEVREIIKYQNKRFDGNGYPLDPRCGDAIPLGSRLLKIVIDFDLLVSATQDVNVAIATMQSRGGWYDPAMLRALKEMHGDGPAEERLEEVNLAGLRSGMIIADDVKTRTGLLVMGRGQEITDGVRERIRNFALRMSVVEPIRVRVKVGAERRVGLPRAN